MKPFPLCLVLGVLCAIAPTAPATEAAGDDFAAQLVKLTTSRGDTYHNCRVLNFTPDAITLMHDGGVKKVPLHLLPAALQQRFRYDAEEAMAYTAAEKEKQRLAAEQRQALEAESSRQRQYAAVSYARTNYPAYLPRVSSVESLMRTSMSQRLPGYGYYQPYDGDSSYAAYYGRSTYNRYSYDYWRPRRTSVIYYSTPRYYTAAPRAYRLYPASSGVSTRSSVTVRPSVNRWVIHPR